MNKSTALLLSLILLTPTYFITAAYANQLIPSKDELRPVQGVDLGIADDATYRRPNSWALREDSTGTKYAEVQIHQPQERLLAGDLSGPSSRPGISIAWRNAAQVEEVEVRIQNLGTEPANGRVWVEVLDATGKQLLYLEPPEEMKTIRVPSYSRGGKEGKVLRMKASRALNNLIDRFDRERRRYNVRATVEAINAQDVNPFDNKKTKSWNVPHRVEPQFRNTLNYVFTNHTNGEVDVKWVFEHTPYPKNWRVQGVPNLAEPFTMAKGATVKGTLWLDAPGEIDEGAFLESRLSLVNANSSEIFLQQEWFQAFDTEPPTVSNYRMVMTEDHRIAIQALVADSGSGVMEATGVTTEYSTDGGLTWSQKAHNYKVGNFVVPTLFEAVLGPFKPDTDVQLRFTAKDTVGNSVSKIPDDAVAIIAPSGAEALLQFGYIFPRTFANPIFGLEPGESPDLSEYISSLAATSEAISETMVMEFQQELQRSVEPLGLAPLSLQSVETGSMVTEIEQMTLRRLDAPGAQLLRMDTLAISVK